MATMQHLSDFQKENCLFCNNKATQEAFAQNASESHTANIRCCDNPDCAKKACDHADRSIGQSVSH